MDNELSRTVDALPGLVWTAFPDGRIEFVNRRWCEYTGLSVEQAAGEGWQTAFHPDDRRALLEAWQTVVASGERGEAEARMRRFDGTYRWFLCRTSPIADVAGEIVKWCGINSDIEDRKQTEAALRAQEQRFELIVDRLPTRVILLGPDGDVLHANRHTLDYSGVTIEELKAWKTNGLTHPDDREAVIARFRASISTGEPYDAESRHRRADGIYRWFRVQGFPLRDNEGRIALWYFLQTDIDDRKRAEALRAELAHLSCVNSQGVLTASIAHEINQPLAGIVTNASTSLRMLSAEPPNVEGALETVRRTIRDGHRASEVMTRLRALFSKKAVTTDAVDLVEATREVVGLLQDEIRNKRIVLHLKAADDLPPVAGDRVQLQQVVLNLLLNAVEAMNGVEDRPRRMLVNIERDDGDCVRLAVTDSGVGFDPQHASKLFDPFSTTKREGMGIGLSVSRSIIESHGGRLWASSNTDQGATFTFSIPRRAGSISASDQSAPTRQSAHADAEQAERSR
jgi:PAS domain S-box-containing protein